MNKSSENNKRYRINLSFEEIKLPPFQEILVLAKDCQQGKIGLSKSIELLNPNGFELKDPKEQDIEAVFVSKKILNKISWENVLAVLQEKVFPYVARGEIVRVEFKVNIDFPEIELEAN